MDFKRLKLLPELLRRIIGVVQRHAVKTMGLVRA